MSVPGRHTVAPSVARTLQHNRKTHGAVKPPRRAVVPLPTSSTNHSPRWSVETQCVLAAYQLERFTTQVITYAASAVHISGEAAAVPKKMTHWISCRSKVILFI